MVRVIVTCVYARTRVPNTHGGKLIFSKNYVRRNCGETVVKMKSHPIQSPFHVLLLQWFVNILSKKELVQLHSSFECANGDGVKWSIPDWMTIIIYLQYFVPNQCGVNRGVSSQFIEFRIQWVYWISSKLSNHLLMMSCQLSGFACILTNRRIDRWTSQIKCTPASAQWLNDHPYARLHLGVIITNYFMNWGWANEYLNITGIYFFWAWTH